MNTSSIGIARVRAVVALVIVLVLTVFQPAASQIASNISYCQHDLPVGSVCYTGLAPTCIQDANSCTGFDKRYAFTGNTCWATFASCDSDCWTGNKTICVVKGDDTERDILSIPFKDLLPLTELIKDSNPAIYKMMYGGESIPPTSEYYYDSIWYQALSKPSGVPYRGCEQCAAVLETILGVVTSLAWADPEIGPFAGAAAAPISLIGNYIFTGQYRDAAIRPVGDQYSIMDDVEALRDLKNIIAQKRRDVAAAVDHLSAFYNFSYNAPAEGASAQEMLKTLRGTGPFGMQAIEKAWRDLQNLDVSGAAVPTLYAVPPPAAVYAADAWMSGVDAWIQATKAAAILQVFPTECMDKSKTKECRTKYSNKTVKHLLKEAWGGNDFVLNQLVIELAKTNGIIDNAQALKKTINESIKKRLDMIKVGQGAYATCGTVVAVGFGRTNRSTHTFSGNYVTDSGLPKDLTVSALVDPSRIDYRLQIGCKDEQSVTVSNLVAIDSIEDLTYKGSPQKARSANDEGRKWAYFTAHKYYYLYNYQAVASLDKHVSGWNALLKELCDTIPQHGPKRPAAQYCEKSWR